MSANRNWIDGPKLVAWLEDHGLRSPREQLGHREYRIRRWRDGGKANVYAVDETLTTLGLCLGQLPDDLYTDPPSWGRPERPELLARAVRRVIDDGAALKTAAREIGVDPKTVRRRVQLERAA